MHITRLTAEKKIKNLKNSDPHDSAGLRHSFYSYMVGKPITKQNILNALGSVSQTITPPSMLNVSIILSK